MNSEIEDKISQKLLRFHDPILLINNQSEKTIVFFQGCFSRMTTDYRSDELEKIDNKLPWLMKNTVESIKDFNYIFVNDFFQVYYLLNYNDILDSLKNCLSNLNSNKLIFIGTSAGGFGSILYGSVLKPNKVVAFSPQISLKNNHYIDNNIYRKSIFEKYNKNIVCNDLSKLQSFNGLVKIYYGNNEFDKKQIKLLDLGDQNLIVNFLEVKKHFAEDTKDKKIIKEIILKEMYE